MVESHSPVYKCSTIAKGSLTVLIVASYSALTTSGMAVEQAELRNEALNNSESMLKNSRFFQPK